MYIYIYTHVSLPSCVSSVFSSRDWPPGSSMKCKNSEGRVSRGRHDCAPVHGRSITLECLCQGDLWLGNTERIHSTGVSCATKKCQKKKKKVRKTKQTKKKKKKRQK